MSAYYFFYGVAVLFQSTENYFTFNDTIIGREPSTQRFSIFPGSNDTLKITLTGNLYKQWDNSALGGGGVSSWMVQQPKLEFWIESKYVTADGTEVWVRRRETFDIYPTNSQQNEQFYYSTVLNSRRDFRIGAKVYNSQYVRRLKIMSGTYQYQYPALKLTIEKH